MFDAIVIPGGGVREGGALPPWIAARFDRAIDRSAGSELFLPLSAGTPYRLPPLDERGFAITEARAGARYLIERGVDPRRIAIEEWSYDTLGNAYFSRVAHVIPRGLQRLLVVTSEFHMPRVEAVFRWAYELESPGPRCALEFDPSPNIGVEPDALRARVDKERESLARFEAVRNRIGNLAELHEYLFSEHGVYAAVRRIDAAPADTSTY